MKQIGYFLFRATARVVGLMPLWVWRILMFVLYIFIYYLFGYRRKVTRDNLEKSFPDFSKEKINAIEKKYYKNLARLVIEVFASKHLSRKFFEKQIPVHHANLITDYTSQGRKVIMMSGHFGNWEWAGIRLGLLDDSPLHIIYKPVTDPFFEKYMKQLRMNLGNETLSLYMMPRHLLTLKGSCITCILADQTPASTENLWLSFLGRDTLFFSAIEKLARRIDAVIVFGNMLPGEDGRYNISVELIADNMSQIPEGQLMPMYVKLLERNIYENPYNWLWSHRRWKHQKH